MSYAVYRTACQPNLARAVNIRVRFHFHNGDPGLKAFYDIRVTTICRARDALLIFRSTRNIGAGSVKRDAVRRLHPYPAELFSVAELPQFFGVDESED